MYSAGLGPIGSGRATQCKAAPFKTAQRAGLAILGASAVAVLTGCGSGSPAAAPTVTVTTTRSAGTGPAAPASSDPAASTDPAATTAPAASTGPGTCPPSALHVSLGDSEGAAGTFYRVIVLTNTSGSACTLYGYPGVSFVTRPGGSVIGAPARRNPLIPDTLITMQPGATASALSGLVDTGALPTAQCQ